MTCETCGNTLIAAIDTEDHYLMLVHNPKLYGKTWGSYHNVKREGETYLLVWAVLGIYHKHEDVCQWQPPIDDQEFV